MLNADVMRLWVDALRSGEYEQTTGVLTRVDDNGERSHCCLGVLTELAIENGVDIPTKVEDGCVIYGEDWFGMTPTEVQEWASFHSTLPNGMHLPTLNDQGATFAEIADLIEEQTLNG